MVHLNLQVFFMRNCDLHSGAFVATLANVFRRAPLRIVEASDGGTALAEPVAKTSFDEVPQMELSRLLSAVIAI